MSIKDKFIDISTQTIIALFIMIAGFSFLFFRLGNPATESSVTNMMLLVIGFYFGSSRSTTKKDETIANIAENQKQ